VDVVPPVCKQGVGGSSPPSSTGQKRNSNGRDRLYSSKVQQRGPHEMPRICPSRPSPSLRGRGHSTQIPRPGRGFRTASRKNAVLPVPVCLSHDQWPAPGNCRFIVAPAVPAEGQLRRVPRYFMSLTVCFSVTHHEVMVHISPILWSGLEASTTSISCRYAPVVDYFPGACPPADLALISFSLPIFAFLFSCGTPFNYMSTTHEPYLPGVLVYALQRTPITRYRLMATLSGQSGTEQPDMGERRG
jgi:hypothetical protein